ncbi:hypothetical protein EMCRGX_G013500 [Ephydatia muelleri]
MRSHQRQLQVIRREKLFKKKIALIQSDDEVDVAVNSAATNDAFDDSEVLCESEYVMYENPFQIDIRSAAEMSVENTILHAVLNAMKIQQEFSGSQEQFMRILNYDRDLYCKGDSGLQNRWPSSWQSCVAILQAQGYTEPRKLYICLDEEHPFRYDVMDSPISTCKYCGKQGSIPYYYLRLSDKIKRWCQDAMFCKKITAHWREKEHWLKAEHKNFKKCEIWDGSRFAEYAWFWDPTALWHLPALCPLCKHVVSSKYMNEVSKQNMNANGTVSIECPNCDNCFDHLLKSTRGDPRNIALIGSIEVSIATMRKSDRSKVDEVYVCGFVPSYLLPNKCPVSLDPFLEPLVTEVLDLFINGKGALEIPNEFKNMALQALRLIMLLRWQGFPLEKHLSGVCFYYGQEIIQHSLK